MHFSIRTISVFSGASDERKVGSGPARRLAVAVGAAAIAALILMAPASPARAAETPLYDRLGGAYPIAVVVDELIDRLLANGTLNANPAIDAARERVPAPGLKYHVTSFVIQATGGPEVYIGRSMKASHEHLKITERQWQAMLAELRGTLYAFDVPEAEQRELMELVGTLKGDIVTASE